MATWVTAGLDKCDMTWMMPNTTERHLSITIVIGGGGGVCVNHPAYMTKEVVYLTVTWQPEQGCRQIAQFKNEASARKTLRQTQGSRQATRKTKPIQKKRWFQREKRYRGWEGDGMRAGRKSQTDEEKMKPQSQKLDKEENKEKRNNHRQKPEERLSRCPDKITAHEQLSCTDVAAASDSLYWSSPSVSKTLIYMSSFDKRKWAKLNVGW